MEKELNIKYHWNLTDYPDLSDEMLERLDIEAKERIFNQILGGYVEGELIHEEEDIRVYGWWCLF